MASSEQVKQYIASWLQLGRKIVVDESRGTLVLSTAKVIESGDYTQEFEDIWQKVSSDNPEKSYLQGTHETIAQLMTPAWEVTPCAVCNMAIAMPQVGTKTLSCPCSDLANWPNNNLPIPVGLVSSQARLAQIRERLLTANHRLNSD